MEIVDGVYKDVVKISSHEVDQQNSIHPYVYLLMMQEAAGFHAYQKNLSIPQLMKEGKTWVVTRTKMEIYNYVGWPNSINLETWPQKPWRFYFPRVCRVSHPEVGALFTSLSQWVIVDLKTQRPIKPEQINFMKTPVKEPIEVNPDLGRKLRFDKESYDKITTYNPTVMYEDSDLNQHINNVIYFKWMLDSLDFSFRESHKLVELDISYLAQAYNTDKIEVLTATASLDGLILHHQVSNEEGKVFSVASTKWVSHPQ